MRHVIIVTVYNKPLLTRRCLEAIARLTDLQLVHLVVVDDHSRKPTANIVHTFGQRHQSVTIIRNRRNLGKPRSLNKVLAMFPRARYYTIIDNDVWLQTPDWISVLERCHQDWNDRAILGGQTYMTGFKVQKNGRTYLDPWPYWTLAGCFFSLSGRIFRGVGYFFDQSARSEDADYCRRAYVAGFRWYYTTAVRAGISGHKDRAERRRQAHQHLRGQRVRRRWGDQVMITHKPFYQPKKLAQHLKRT